MRVVTVVDDDYFDVCCTDFILDIDTPLIFLSMRFDTTSIFFFVLFVVNMIKEATIANCAKSKPLIKTRPHSVHFCIFE